MTTSASRTVRASIPLDDGSWIPAVLARPSGQSQVEGWPAVIVLHEIFGLTPDIEAAAQRLADDGYVAVAPDLLAHGGPRALCLARAMAEVHSGRPGRTTADVEATRRWLIGQPTVDRDRLGVIGFCMGGGFALAFAAGGPDGLRAASVNYGEVPEDAEALRRVCPVVASYGGRDRVVGPQAARLEQHLQRLGVEHDVQVYDAAGHAFMTPGKRRPLTELVMFPTHPGYEPESAGDAWARVLRFFDEHVRKGRATR